MRISSTLRTAASIGAISLAVPAFAADLPARTVAPVFDAPPTFTVILAVGPEITPSFPGSKTFQVLPSFHLDYLKPGEHASFYTADDSLSVTLYNGGFFKIGPAANYLSRRGLSNGNGQFAGLPNVGDSIEVGGFAELWPLQDRLRIRGEIRKAVTGYKGLVGSIGADVIGQLGPFTASIGPRVKFGDQRYADRFFTITPIQAFNNGLVTPYQAKGGLTSYGGFATVSYNFNETYGVTLFGGYDRLASSVGASPVATVLGTRDQFTAGATLDVKFAFKGFGIFGY